MPTCALLAIGLLAVPVSAAPAASDPTAAPAPGAASPPAVEPAGAAAPSPATSELASPSETLRFAELPNFHQVNEHLYRGGQPAAAGYSRLRTLGVRTVLNLRYERREIRAEAKATAAAGLRYFSVPMYGLSRPTDQQIHDALAIIDDSANWPVFVHCERGSDRTGVVVACHRVAQARWTAERAITEAMSLGMWRIEASKRAYIRDFSEKLSR